MIFNDMSNMKRSRTEERKIKTGRETHKIGEKNNKSETEAQKRKKEETLEEQGKITCKRNRGTITENIRILLT